MQPSITEEAQMPTLSDYLRKTAFLDKYQELFTKNQLDWWIRHRESNGLTESGCLIKAANQWFIHVDLFTEWFGKQKA
jgi:hypothetical protein